MEIIKANYNYVAVGECTCPNCDSELRYTRKDMVFGLLGSAYIICPVCGERILDINTPKIKKEFCKDKDY